MFALYYIVQYGQKEPCLSQVDKRLFCQLLRVIWESLNMPVSLCYKKLVQFSFWEASFIMFFSCKGEVKNTWVLTFYYFYCILYLPEVVVIYNIGKLHKMKVAYMSYRHRIQHITLHIHNLEVRI